MAGPYSKGKRWERLGLGRGFSAESWFGDCSGGDKWATEFRVALVTPSLTSVSMSSPLTVSAKVGLSSFSLQCALVVVADFYLRETDSQSGAWVILVSWLVGFIAIVSGIVTTTKTRRYRWLGLSAAAFLMACFALLYFAGFGL